MRAHRSETPLRPASKGHASSAPWLALLASVVLLSACDRAGDNRSAGQKLDSAIATTEQKTAEASKTAKEASRDAGQAMSNAGDAVAAKAKDVTITAAVNARLASDERLSALNINVDTSGGRVVLRGTAPDTASRTRATELARTVDGVTAVENELSVQQRAQ
jgi:hyperosmotically inducible periplasmic protein